MSHFDDEIERMFRFRRDIRWSYVLSIAGIACGIASIVLRVTS